MSSMKNQIQEVIKEDLNESIKSHTGRSPMDNSKMIKKKVEVIEVNDSFENKLIEDVQTRDSLQ